MPRNLYTQATDRYQILYLILGLFLCIEYRSFAQQSATSPPFKIFLPSTSHFCPQAPFDLAADSIIGGTAPFHFRWLISNEIVGIDSVAHLNLSDTTSIELRVIDSHGKIMEASAWLYPYAPIDASFSVDFFEGCSPLEVVFQSNFVSFQNCQSMNWNLGNGTEIPQLASCSFNYQNEGLYEPSLHITDLHGCIWSDTLEIPIRVFPNPHASYSLESTRIYLPENKLNVLNTSSGGDHFIWLLSGSQPVFEFEPTIEVPEGIEGTYELALIAENAFGCRSTESKSIEVVQAIEIYIPNCFTPNGDGINDEWKLDGMGIDNQHIALEVRDVWGTIVYSSNRLDEAWQGTSDDDNKRVPSGTYNYRLIARDSERGIGHLFEGHVYILY